VLAPLRKWRRERPIKGTFPHVVSIPREVIARAFKNQLKFLNWYLIEKMASRGHVSDGSRSFVALPGVSLP
jgi:hypothetical protein